MSSDASSDEINVKYLRYLRHAMYRLYYVPDVALAEQMDPRDLEVWRHRYSSELRTNIVRAIEWALENTSFDLTGVLPQLPHSDPQVRAYLAVVLHDVRADGLA